MNGLIKAKSSERLFESRFVLIYVFRYFNKTHGRKRIFPRAVFISFVSLSINQ